MPRTTSPLLRLKWPSHAGAEVRADFGYHLLGKVAVNELRNSLINTHSCIPSLVRIRRLQRSAPIGVINDVDK